MVDLEPSISNVLRLGLLRFPEEGKTFPGRHGNAKQYLIDTRGAGTKVDLRSAIVKRLQMRLAEIRTATKSVDVIAGLSKSGTIWGAWLAWQEGLPFANVLSEPRSAGLQRQVEGDVQSRSVVLVDNWSRTGTSVNTACSAVSSCGGSVVAILTIVSHPSVSVAAPLYSGWQLRELLDGAVDLGLAPPDLQMD